MKMLRGEMKICGCARGALTNLLGQGGGRTVKSGDRTNGLIT